jgi:hypothetical protein
VARFCAERGYRPQYVYAWLGEAATLMARMRADGEVHEHPTTIIARDGRVAVMVTVLPLRDPAGAVVGTGRGAAAA